ncbi:MAG: hypothetical protein ACE5NM_12710 [Sedimentisphaerales bacterium]
MGSTMNNDDNKLKKDSHAVDVSTNNTQIKQQTKWAILAVAVLVLIFMIVVGLSNSPQDIFAKSQQRDLSTPSSRLIGHWKNVEGDGGVYYSPIDPALRIGTYRLCNTPYGSYGPPFQFRILFEEPSGQKLIIRVFKNLALKQLEATTGLDFSKSDIVCCISKDGQLMSQEYTCMGERVLVVYRYVDNKTTP